MFLLAKTCHMAKPYRLIAPTARHDVAAILQAHSLADVRQQGEPKRKPALVAGFCFALSGLEPATSCSIKEPSIAR